MNNQQEIQLYIGTYTQRLPHVDGKGEGIYHCRFNLSSGKITVIDHTSGIENPSYLVVDLKRHRLYAVQETDTDYDPAVFAYAIRPETGSLKYLNRQPAHGSSPCHLTIDQTGKFVVVVNYGSGSISIYPVLEDGRLGEVTDIVQHEGSSLNPDRQEGPHAHAVAIDKNNRFVLVSDLGLDKIMIYRLDLTQGRLLPHNPPFAPVQPGAGPRHLAFHPNGQFVFAINELDGTLASFDYHAGTLTSRQTMSTLPSDFYGERSCAAIRVAPSGRFVYGSNRGHDSIVIYAFNEASGSLTMVGHESTQGQTPRDFAIDPTGTFLLVANQDSDTIITFGLEQQTGRLQPTGQVTHIPSPVCIDFA